MKRVVICGKWQDYLIAKSLAEIKSHDEIFKMWFCGLKENRLSERHLSIIEMSSQIKINTALRAERQKNGGTSISDVTDEDLNHFFTQG